MPGPSCLLTSRSTVPPEDTGQPPPARLLPLKISRAFALFAGIALPCVETWRRWRMLSDWPLWLDDYLAAALLLYSWYAGRRAIARSRPYLMAAWGYTLGIAYLSLAAQWKAGLAASDPSGVPAWGVLAFKTFGLVLAAACLGLAWREPTGSAE